MVPGGDAVYEIQIGLRPGADAESVQQALRSLDRLDVKAIHTDKQSGHVALRVALEMAPRADWPPLLATIATRDDVRDLQRIVERELVTD